MLFRNSIHYPENYIDNYKKAYCYEISNALCENIILFIWIIIHIVDTITFFHDAFLFTIFTIVTIINYFIIIYTKQIDLFYNIIFLRETESNTFCSVFGKRLTLNRYFGYQWQTDIVICRTAIYIDFSLWFYTL